MKSTIKFLSLLIFLFTIYWSFSDIIPSASFKDDINNSDTFSINNALSHLKKIAQKPHSPGTNEHRLVQEYLVNELKKLGLQPEIQVETVFNNQWKAGATVENIITKIKGTSNNKSLLLLSHYDSNPHSSIGASDAGSGIVTILEGIRAFLAKGEKPKNDIIILFSDAEELGLLGAEAFVKHHPFAKDIGLVLNFEARGSGGPSYMLMETNGKNSKLLEEFLKANPKHPAANSLMYSVYKMLPNDTDLTVFREKANINGFNFAFIGDHFDYHTELDTYDRLDRASLIHQKEYFTSSLNYFSNADLSNLNSDKDVVYINFPIIGLLTFPFSWIFPFILIAILFFCALIFIGIRKKRLTAKGIFTGFLPFLIALISSTVISFALWKLLTFIHPYYKDILQGFTYNGYYYITAFVFLTLWVSFKSYNLFKNNKPLDLLIAPVFIWILINFAISKYLPGAGFFIIPVFVALIGITFYILKNNKPHTALFAFISIPTIYIFAPLIKMFPVGLGLKNLFISSIFTVLTISLLIPAFQEYKKKNLWQKLFGFLSIIVFVLATSKSDFSVSKKKPNSLVYIQNSDNESAFWGTYNKTLDSYTKQIFNSDFSEGSITNAETKSKYNTRFNYYKKAPFNKRIKTSEIEINLDTIIGNNREIWLTIKPQRKINKYEIFNNKKISISSLTANSAIIYDTLKEIKNETLLVYHMGNSDKDLKIALKFNKTDQLNITLNEISNDLLSHPEFNLQQRNEKMIPMPFVTNDAIISTKTLSF